MTTRATIDAAIAVDRTLRAAEASSHDAAIGAADLLATLLRQHRAMDAAATVGLAAIRHASRAATLAVEAREEQIRAHGALNIDLKKIGLDEMFSKDSDPPNPAFDWRTYVAELANEPAAA